MAALFQRACNWIAVSSFAAWFQFRPTLFVWTHQRLRQGFFGGPSSKDSAFQRIFRQANSLRPFPYCERLSQPFDTTVVAHISHLLLTCGPTAVVGFVVTAIVDAIQFEVRWFFTHIFKKRCEIIAPLVTHRDAAATIKRVVLMSLIEAAAFRAVPRPVSGRTTVFPRRVSVTSHPALSIVTFPAAATNGTPTGQAVSQDETNGPTVTDTPPSYWCSFDSSENAQSPKNLLVKRWIRDRHSLNYRTDIHVFAGNYV